MDITEQVKGHISANYLSLAYRAPKKLWYKSTTKVSPVRTADDRLVSDASEVRVRWAKYFEGLYRADSPTRRLPTADVQIVVADLPIIKAPYLSLR